MKNTVWNVALFAPKTWTLTNVTAWHYRRENVGQAYSW